MKSGTRLEKAIEAMGERTGLEFSDLFSNFLDLSLTLLCNNPSDHQKKLMERQRRCNLNLNYSNIIYKQKERDLK